MPQTEARRVFGVGRTSIHHWLKAHAKGGDAALKAHKRGPKQRSRLAGHQVRTERAEIHWGDEMGMRSDHQAGRSDGLKEQTPVIPGTGRRFGCNMSRRSFVAWAKSRLQEYSAGQLERLLACRDHDGVYHTKGFGAVLKWGQYLTRSQKAVRSSAMQDRRRAWAQAQVDRLRTKVQGYQRQVAKHPDNRRLKEACAFCGEQLRNAEQLLVDSEATPSCPVPRSALLAELQA